LIKREAVRYGVNVVSSEIVGLIPQQALLEAAEFYLQVENFSRQMVLESHLEEMEATPESFLEEVAAPTPTPGGGSVAALAGALAAALTSMVCNLTVGRASDVSAAEELGAELEQAEALRHELAALVEEDAKAYRKVLEAYRLPKSATAEKEVRSKAIQEALVKATAVPLKVASGAVGVLEVLPSVLERGLPAAASDAGVSAYMAEAALRAAALNVRTNLSSLRDTRSFQEQLSSLEARAQELMDVIEKGLAARM